MNNIAVVFAGGTGQRMNQASRPKQFLELYGKPILVYTLEHFSNHPEIDGVVVVCLRQWLDYCVDMIEKFKLKKIISVVPGGGSGQESIYNGLVEVNKYSNDETVVLIHDGVRPLINAKTITEAILCVRENSSAITVSPAIETIVQKDMNKRGKITSILPRQFCELAKAPQCFYLKDILKAHKNALKEGLTDFVDSASLMRHYGHELTTIEGPAENLKITTPIDFYVFRAVIDAKENMKVIGL